MHFLEIGTDKNHVHFLIQSVPMMLPQRCVQIVKSITARQVFAQAPEIKQKLWGGQFWTDGYFLTTVGKYNSETAIAKYVKEQGTTQEYVQLHKDQLTLFI